MTRAPKTIRTEDYPYPAECASQHCHTLYEAFEPERARELVRRIEFHQTPKHGSWLNIAENELSSLTRQCVSGRRFGDIATPQAEVAAWSTDVNWQMTVDNARTKLTSIYPKIRL